MSPANHGRAALKTRFPRVSGDEPAYKTLLPLKGLFSPRERG